MKFPRGDVGRAAEGDSLRGAEGGSDARVEGTGDPGAFGNFGITMWREVVESSGGWRGKGGRTSELGRELPSTRGIVLCW